MANFLRNAHHTHTVSAGGTTGRGQSVALVQQDEPALLGSARVSNVIRIVLVGGALDVAVAVEALAPPEPAAQQDDECVFVKVSTLAERDAIGRANAIVLD